MDELDWRAFDADMIARIKATLLAHTIAPELGLVQVRGQKHKWSCPLCGSRDNLDIYERHHEPLFCNSLGCEMRGDVIRLVRATLQIDFGEAVRWAAMRVGIDYDGERDAFLGRDPRATWTPRTPALLPVAAPVRLALDAAELEQLKAQGRRALAWIASHVDELGDEAARWLEQERGLDPQMCVHLGLRSTSGARWGELVSEAVELFGEETVRLAGVLRADGAAYPRALPHFIPFIYHDAAGAPESMRIRRLTKPGDKPKCLSLLNPPHLDVRGFWAPARPFLESTALETAQRLGCPLYICEGEMDALAVWQAGRPALAVPGAGAWRAGWCASWASLARVIILAHQDGARATGEGLAYTIADRARGELGDEATRRILRGEIIPAGAGFKDANDLLRAGRLGRYLGACEDKP